MNIGGVNKQSGAVLTKSEILEIHANDNLWTGNLIKFLSVLEICRHFCSTCEYSDSLWAGLSGDWIPVEARFSAPLQTGPGPHPASYTMGNGSFPGVKQPVNGIDHSPPYSAKVKERVELYLYSTSGPSRPVIGWTLLLPFLQ